MFAPKVAKPQTKATASSTRNLAHQRSTLEAQQRTPQLEGETPTDPIREATKGKFQTENATSSEPQCAGPAPAINNMMSSPGRPLDADTRKDMEFRFGHDFSQVRVHTDSIA